MSRKKMGGLGKLSQFSGIKSQQTETLVAEPSTELAPVTKSEAKAKAKQPSSTSASTKKEKMVTINIKITSTQKEWLAQTASTVRDNNTEPVPPGVRVFPQHLIGVAIELLQNSDVDWSQVKNVEELQEQLNL